MKNLFNLENKVALITGSTSGMGKAIAEVMGVHGAKVIVSSNYTEGGRTYEILKFCKSALKKSVLICENPWKKKEKYTMKRSEKQGLFGHRCRFWHRKSDGFGVWQRRCEGCCSGHES